jgi:hypothetical protein
VLDEAPMVRRGVALALPAIINVCFSFFFPF